MGMNKENYERYVQVLKEELVTGSKSAPAEISSRM